jgi:MoaA/NifB/PqqE/SkfB family radical SAM enzyme
MKTLVPVTAKAEFHLTYRCSLGCAACSRASWLKTPHTEDMTIEDCKEFFRQADAIGWKQMQPDKEKARIIFIGGEPTLHPQFLEMVKICSEWSDTYVQVYSNGYTERSRQLLETARLTFSASIFYDSFKKGSIAGPTVIAENNWDLNMYVSPSDAGIENMPPCYAHPSEICGFCVDHDGYGICCIGGSVSRLLNDPLGRTKNLADLFDPIKAAEFTRRQCQHCGFEFRKRPIPPDVREKYLEHAKTCETIRGCKMSPTWKKVFEERK